MDTAFLGLTVGVVVAILGLILFWILHTKWGKSIGGVYWFCLSAVVFVVFFVPWLIRGLYFGFGNIDKAVQEGQQQYSQTNPKPLVSQQQADKIISGLNWGSSSSSGGSGSGSEGGNNYTDPNGGSGGESGGSSGGGQQTITTYELKPEAASLWLDQFTIAIGGSLYPVADPTVNASFFPVNSHVTFSCSGCWWNISAHEKWDVCVVPKENWVTKVCFKTNGEVARNLGVSYSRNKINSFTGTMPWESIPGAVVAVETVVTPDPNAAATPADESSETTSSEGTVYTVKDPTGADWYTPVDGGCEEVTFKKQGVIPLGDSVTITEVYTNAGRVVWRGSKDLGLTADNKCLYMGTLK